MNIVCAIYRNTFWASTNLHLQSCGHLILLVVPHNHQRRAGVLRTGQRCTEHERALFTERGGHHVSVAVMEDVAVHQDPLRDSGDLLAFDGEPSEGRKGLVQVISRRPSGVVLLPTLLQELEQHQRTERILRGHGRQSTVMGSHR